MSADIDPPALARLVDFAERPRTNDWSLRSALVRYGQAEPQRVNDLIVLVRRTDGAIRGHTAVLEREGAAIWDALAHGATADDAEHAHVVRLLRVATELDRIGEVLAAWAVDISAPRPNDAVDDAIEAVAAQLDALGVPHEKRPANRRRGV